MSGRVAIVDYGMGNLGSVANALRAVGGEPAILSRPEDLAGFPRIVVPGVGAFAEAMAHLQDSGLIGALEHARQAGVPVLGICLGMQLFAKSSEEHGLHDGLGWIDARVRQFPPEVGLKVPHMGWDDVAPTRVHPLIEGIGEGSDFYFVHSYYVDCADPADVLLAGRYGRDYCAMFARENVAGAQFHPEKSQRPGLRLLKNFLAWQPC